MYTRFIINSIFFLFSLSLLKNTNFRKAFVTHWTTVAKRFKGNPNVIGFGLFPTFNLFVATKNHQKKQKTTEDRKKGDFKR